MKRINYLIIAVIGLAAMFACQKEESSQISELETKVVHFYAGELETKTAFGDRTSEGKYPTLWTANDSKVKISLNYATEKSATVKVADDKKTASFDAEIEDDDSGSYTFYALSPATASYAQYNEDTKTVGITIPSSQTPSEKSVDELAQVLVAKSSTTDVFPENVELPFTHVLAYGRMSLSNLVLAYDEVISSVAITASKNFSGRYHYSPETGKLIENSASSTISITTSSSADIWFACAPVDLSNGGTMQVVVNTNKGTYTKEVTFPAEKGNFESGYVVKFSVNMQGVPLVSPDIYTLVKSKSELTVDSEVIIVAKSANYAISTTQNSNNRAQAGITKTGETIEGPAANVQRITLVKGSQENTAALKVGDSYLYSVSGQNQLKTGYLNDAASWVISVSAEGVASINNYANKDYYIMYNSSNEIFSCYKNTQESVSVYKLNGSGSADQIFLPVLDSPVLTVSTDNSTKTITVSWKDVPNATSYFVECEDKSATILPEVQTCSFTMDEYGTYDVSVTALAEGYTSAKATDSAELSDPSLSDQLGEPYSQTFFGENITLGNPLVLGSISWTITTKGSTSINSGTEAKGKQFGTQSKPCTELKFVGTGYTGGISKIVVNSSCASNTGPKIASVKVGGVSMTAPANTNLVKGTNTAYSFTSASALTGDIEIIWTSSASAGIYVKQIDVN